ncbi:MAG: Mu-like prophage major head subunit gpT family protein [Telluria sp.]|nr:Mu-like prophage major head subunit gpT family protein [Telluria sp.]
MTQISTVRDERKTIAEGMADALLNRINPSSQLSDNGRRFRSMTLMEMSREALQESGVNVRGLSRMEVAGMALNSRAMTSIDFPSILANVGNKRLRQAYQESPATYKIWARQAPNAADFKPVTTVQLGGMPDLLQVREHGEYKYGAISDGAETYALLTYGRVIALTRQAMVNDDLRAFGVALTSFGNASARLENRTVYAQLTANGNLADGTALFGVGRNNLGSGAGSALQASSLAAMRTAMRLQKGLQSEELNIAPQYLIVPAALEQTAYQLTSSQYVPAKQSDVNEFRQGGRSALTPVVEPVLDSVSSLAWYAAANHGQIDTVEFMYLDGAEGPVMESQTNFSTDGMSLKCRLDFAAKAIDFRGLYKSNGS